MYKFDTRIRYSEADATETLSIPGIIDYFQDAAIFQSKDLGVGTEDLAKKERAWIVCSWQVDIERMPKVGENVTIGTFPYDFKSLFGLRNCFIMGEGGEYLAKANCIWALMNTTTLKAERVTEDIASVYPLEEKLDMEYMPRKLMLPKESGEKLEAFAVNKTHLDSLGHVNNAQYVRFALSCCDLGTEIKRFRAEYIRQAHAGDILYPERWIVEKTIYIALKDENGDIYASVSFEKR